MSEEEKQYVVLARKYRPQNFDDLVGQDALVQTLTNAIKNNRLHHAYMLTGIRGVGKTTTARIIAKALNCIGLDGKGGPTIHPCGVCENCTAISQDRHIDVLELDAASRTGVDDIREILDGVRYKPTNARYKIYIIDEVHMLSKNAFNALLKTLEEPPPHVKFIFATTEIRKVPVTVLSRCQRFDLQRLTIDDLLGLFNKLIKAEGLKADEEALHIIAKAADGSARDGLSLLDQAISLGSGVVKTEVVKQMIGLADRTQTFEMFEALVNGEIEKVVKNLQNQYKNGANPLTILQDLANIAHMIAKAKIIPAFAEDVSLSENERDLIKKLKDVIPIAVLSKIWQMLLKGIYELNIAPSQIDAVEMILIRIAYSAHLPTPQEALEGLKKKPELLSPRNCHAEPEIRPDIQEIPKQVRDDAGGVLDDMRGVRDDIVGVRSDVVGGRDGMGGVRDGMGDTRGGGEVCFKSVKDLVAHLEKEKQMLLLYALKNDVSIAEFSDGNIKMTISDKAHPDFVMNLHKVLTSATGKTWIIDILRGVLGETLADEEKASKEEDKRSISEYPLVRAILEEFKGAKFETLTRKVTEDAEEEENDLFFDGELDL